MPATHSAQPKKAKSFLRMLSGHIHVCLDRPEIPQNTGSIGRLVAAAGCRLHLIRPFAFSADDRNLRRAGLDYWPFLDLEIHDSIDDLLGLFVGAKRIAFVETKSPKPYTEIPVEAELLVFGQETKGLSPQLRERFPDAFYQIPMFHTGVRSINLANAVSIVLYNQLMAKQNAHRQG